MKGRRTSRACLALVLMLAAAILVGCSRKGNPPTAAPPTPRPQEPEAASPPTAKVDVVPIDLKGLRAAIERRAGQVVLVDFWATWCKPCVETFPRVVEWQKEYADQELAVLSVSADLPEHEAAVRRFLAEQKPGFPTYILDEDNYDDFVRAFGRDWSGALPALFMFDRTGEMRQQIVGLTDEKTVEAAFVELLREPSGVR